jgi:hypothetical protein
MMRPFWFALMVVGSISAHGAGPAEADRRFADWLRTLTLPGSAGTLCCDIADCQMVEARWNSGTHHYEARVIRNVFNDPLRPWRTYTKGDDPDEASMRDNWTKSWIANYGDVSEIWIEIPEDRINHVRNPTGHAVLCWTSFWTKDNGVFCFVPFIT